MASARDGFTVSALTSSGSDSDSGSDSKPPFIDPTNYGQSVPGQITFGDLTGSRPQASQEEIKPVLPLLQKGAKDQTLRENIITMFGPTGDNTLSLLTLQTMAANAPTMHATYNQSPLGLRHQVTLVDFSNNLMDYLRYRTGGRKKQRRSVIKKRKSMSKKRKNGRKSNKKQRRR
jgi:hypothetical protein